MLREEMVEKGEEEEEEEAGGWWGTKMAFRLIVFL